MTKQDQILRVLKITGKHGIIKLYAAQYLHIFELGDYIMRLRKKGYDIRTSTVKFRGKESFSRYVLKAK